VVGVIKPTYRAGSLEEFIRLLPEGVGVIPLFLGVKSGTEKEFLAAMDLIEAKVDEIAKLGVDIIHPEGAPPFMLRGYRGEAEIIRRMEKKHGKPVFTSGTSQVDAMRALGIRKMLGITYFTGDINLKYAKYFREAGFDVLGMDGIEDVPFSDIGRLTPHEVYAFAKQEYLKHPEAECIYLLGSGWRVLEVIDLLEQDLQVPIIHPVPARVWDLQRRLHIRQPVRGFGRLLAELPPLTIGKKPVVRKKKK
jgi:maleate cis-trans isomerase